MIHCSTRGCLFRQAGLRVVFELPANNHTLEHTALAHNKFTVNVNKSLDAFQYRNECISLLEMVESVETLLCKRCDYADSACLQVVNTAFYKNSFRAGVESSEPRVNEPYTERTAEFYMWRSKI